MKHILINLATGESGIYHTKKDIADIVHLSVLTLNRKHIKSRVIRHKGYLICLDVEEYKATSKIRDNIQKFVSCRNVAFAAKQTRQI
jgi:hypothetical protein